jgi:hypothetical protein
MSKNNKKHKQLSKKTGKTNFARNLLIGGLLAVVLAGGSLAVCNYLNNRRWDFLEQEIAYHIPDWKQAIEQSVAIGPERRLDREEPTLKMLLDEKMSEVQRGAERRGWKDVSVLITEQFYARPEEERHAEAYENYAEDCVNYLHERIPTLERVPLEFVVLKKGDDFSKKSSGKAFIGYDWRRVQRIFVGNEKTDEYFIIGNVGNNEGSFVSGTYNSDKSGIQECFVFFGTGPTALSAPFSEIIPFSTLKATAKHYDAGSKRGAVVNEAISEGISYILTEEMIEKRGIPRGKETLARIQEKMHNNPMSGLYILVPKSIEWLKRNGIEKGLEIYQENPENYLEEIQR